MVSDEIDMHPMHQFEALHFPLKKWMRRREVKHFSQSRFYLTLSIFSFLRCWEGAGGVHAPLWRCAHVLYPARTAPFIRHLAHTVFKNRVLPALWGWILCEDRMRNTPFKVALKRFTATVSSTFVKHNAPLQFQLNCVDSHLWRHLLLPGQDLRESRSQI